jgi:hypothetical protein
LSRISRDEGLLHGVLGLVGGAEHVPAEGQDAAVVTVVQRLEGRLATAPHLLHEPVVAQRGEDLR